MSKFTFKNVTNKMNEQFGAARSTFSSFLNRPQYRGMHTGGTGGTGGSASSSGGLFKWYPRDFGVGLADGVIGHSAFVANTPQKFDGAYAKHFMMIECLAIVPLFCVTTVHYVSTFCLYQSRASMLPGLHNELINRSKAIAFWNENVSKLLPQISVTFRGGMLVMQLATLPVWMVLAATSPAVIHCTLEKSNEILASKYSFMENKGPATIEQLRGFSEQAQDFHRAHCLIKTDYVAALLLGLLILFLCS